MCRRVVALRRVEVALSLALPAWGPAAEGLHLRDVRGQVGVGMVRQGGSTEGERESGAPSVATPAGTGTCAYTGALASTPEGSRRTDWFTVSTLVVRHMAEHYPRVREVAAHRAHLRDLAAFFAACRPHEDMRCSDCGGFAVGTCAGCWRLCREEDCTCATTDFCRVHDGVPALPGTCWSPGGDLVVQPELLWQPVRDRALKLSVPRQAPPCPEGPVKLPADLAPPVTGPLSVATPAGAGACTRIGASENLIKVQRVCTQGGVANARVMRQFDLVVINCSCTASAVVKEAGVSEHGVYAHRKVSYKNEQVAKPQCFDKPGTAVLGRAATKKCAGVVRLHARWGVGAPQRGAASQPPVGATYEVRTDSAKQRAQWYARGLQQLDYLVGGVSSVAFAWAGDARQRRAIQAFAERNPLLRVAVVQDAACMVKDMATLATQAQAQTLQSASHAAHQIAASFENPALHAISQALCDDLDRSLLASPAPPAAAPVGQEEVINQEREAAAQVCLAHLSHGRVEEAQALAAVCRQQAPAPAPQEVITLPGLEDWGGTKADARTARIDHEIAKQLWLHSCEWEWDGPGRTSGAWRWVEQIELHEDGSVTRTGARPWLPEVVLREGVPQRTGARVQGLIRPPRGALMALSKARAAQYDTLQLTLAAIARIEDAIKQGRAQRDSENSAADAQFRRHLQERLRTGQQSPRSLCEDLMGKETAGVFIASHLHSVLAADAVFAARSREQGVYESHVFEAQTREPSGEALSPAGRTAGGQFRIDVSSEGVGKNTPIKVRGLYALASTGERVDIDALLRNVIPDTGSCTFLAGLQWVEELEARAPGCVERVKRLPTSLSGVSGVGGVADALFYVRLRLMHADCELVLHDVPVIANIPGLLLGTDVFGKAGAHIQFWDAARTASDGILCDGEMTLSHKGQTSKPLPFTHRVSTQCAIMVAQQSGNTATALSHGPARPPGSATPSGAGAQLCMESYSEGACVLHAEAADGIHEQSDATNCSGRGGLDEVPRATTEGVVRVSALETAQERAEMAAAQQVAAAAVPIAYAPQSMKVPSWTMKLLRVRVPAQCIGDHTVCVVPFDDERAKQLGLHISSSMQKPGADGCIDVMVQNTSKREKEVEMLAAIGRFCVDPAVEAHNIEFTTEEIMGLINIDEACTEADRKLIAEMIEPNRRLFATVLGYAHGYKMSISTPLIDQGKALPPAAPNRPRSRDENAALREAVDKQLKAGLIMACRSPYNAQPVLVRKADWTPSKPSYRVTLDFRNLNSLTVRDSYPLPSVASHLNALGSANIFSCVDLLMGFHQCELEEADGSRLKTAFGTPWGQFCYKRMPMGLTSSPGCFMRDRKSVV